MTARQLGSFGWGLGSGRVTGLGSATLTALATQIALLNGCSVVAPGGGPPSALGDARWRVETTITATPPVLRLWHQQGGQVTDTGKDQPIVENSVFLPPGLAGPRPEWQLLQLHVQTGRMIVLLQYRPQPSGDIFQQKRFEFDLLAPQMPLVFYRGATTRGDAMNWQTVDFKSRTSQFCRNAPAATAEACKPETATLNDDPVPNLGTMGSAEDYAPPVKTQVRY